MELKRTKKKKEDDANNALKLYSISASACLNPEMTLNQEIKRTKAKPQW